MKTKEALLRLLAPASANLLMPGGAAAYASQKHTDESLAHATKQLRKVNSKEKRSMNETIERAFLQELKDIGAETLAKEAFMLPVPALRGIVKAKKALQPVADVVKKHPLKSVAGAAAVGRYVMPQQKEASAMVRAAKKLKKLSTGDDCY